MTHTLLTPIEDATRREFLALLGAAGLLTGCSTGQVETPATTRPFVDGRGVTVDVPTRPERIVVTHNYLFGGPLLSLSAPVVGGPSSNTGQLHTYLTDHYDTTGITAVGPGTALDIEPIAALRPDLIVVSHLPGDTNATGTRAALAQIAPTVALSDTDNVDALMDQLGRLAGLEDRVAEQRDRWQARLAEVRDVAAPTNLTGVNIRYNPGGPVEVFTPAHPSSITQVLALLGVGTLPVLQAAAADGEQFYNLSPETLGQLRVDVVFWYANDGALDPATIPTWAALPAAAAGQVFREDPARLAMPSYEGYLATVDYLAPFLQRTTKVT